MRKLFAFNNVKRAIEIGKILFPKGNIKKEYLEKIKIVLAVIDDRSIEKQKKGKKNTTSSKFVFNKRGLDQTRTVVEKAGFGFSITIINEAENQSVFGPIIKKEKKGIFTPGNKPEVKPTFIPIKADPALLLPVKSSFQAFVQIPPLLSTFLDVSIIQKLQSLDDQQKI